MNAKYSLKVIQQGQAQKAIIVTPGAGITGQAVVLKATGGARYQLVDIVTLSSPEKLKVKRVGGDLHLALPGSDIEAPDVVIKEYFDISGNVLQGQSIRGEWMSYDITGLTSSSGSGGWLGGTASPIVMEGGVLSQEATLTLSSGSFATTGSALAESGVVLAGDAASGAGAAGASGALAGSNPLLLAAGGVALLGLAGGGGGDSSGTSGSGEVSAALQTLRSYSNAAAGAGVTAPTLTTYKDAGVKALASLSDDTATTAIDNSAVTTALGMTPAAWLTTLNNALDKRTDSNTLTTEQVQQMVNSYYRILSEADGVVNTTTNTDVYPSGTSNAASDNPLASDYTNIGATVGNAKSVDLLNDFVGLSAKTAVDTVDEINAVAKAAYNVMQLAGMTSTAPAAGAAVPALYSTADNDAEWIAGLTALGITGVTTRNIAAVKAAIAAANDDGTGVDTVQEIKDLVNPAIALQVLRDYANSTAGAGAITPTLATFKDAGVKALTNLSETSASADIDGAGVTSAMGTTWLDALKTALDKRTDGNTLSTTQVQALVDSYYRILSEADGVVNTTTNTDVYPGVVDASGGASQAGNNDPSVSDYTNIGATVGNAKSVDLLNDFVGLSAKTAVDTVDEINVVAKAAYNVMLQAGVAAGTGAVPSGYATDAEWIAGLTALGITGVTTRNIAAVKAAIAAANDDGTGVDTVQEIKDLVNPAIALQVLKDYANATNGVGVTTVPTLGGLPLSGSLPTPGTYTDLGIKTFKSLADVSDANRKYFGDSSATAGGESNTFLNAAILNTALDRLTGDATLDKAKVQSMVDSYYRILREADGRYLGDSNGGASYYDGSTPAKIADTDVYADATNDAANAAAFNDPTLADYANIGVTVSDAISATAYSASTGAGNETLDLLNDAIGRMSSASVDTASEVDALATTANDVMLMAKQATGATPAASQTDANLIAGLNNLLGLTTTNGVNTNNLASVKAAIVATNDDGSGVDTVEELLRLLALVRMIDFTDDSAAFGSKTAATPTLSDWTAAGVVANTSLTDGTNVALNQAIYWKTTNSGNGLNALNSALDTYAGSALNTPILQSIVDSYGRILQEADGSRTTDVDVSKISDSTSPVNLSTATDVLEQDLINVGVTRTGTNDGTGTGLFYLKTGELLASVVGSLSSTSVDTVSELNTLMGYAENVMKQAKGASVAYDDTQWVGALNGLGITGANSNNISAIKSAIDASTDNTVGDGSALDTYDELQAIVSLVRLNDYATQNTGFVTPVLADYQAIMAKQIGASSYTDAKSSNLAAYNDAINGQNAISSSDNSVSAMVTGYNLVLGLADGNRGSTPSTTPLAANYNAIFGVSGVVGDGTGTVAYLLNDIINGLSSSQVDSVSELAALVATANKIKTLADGGNATLTRTELANFGLNDGGANSPTTQNSSGNYVITDAEFGNFVNTQLKGSGFANADTLPELQSLLIAAVLAA